VESMGRDRSQRTSCGSSYLPVQNPDCSKEITSQTDASLEGLGAVLTSNDDIGHEGPLLLVVLLSRLWN